MYLWILDATYDFNNTLQIPLPVFHAFEVRIIPAELYLNYTRPSHSNLSVWNVVNKQKRSGIWGTPAPDSWYADT